MIRGLLVFIVALSSVHILFQESAWAELLPPLFCKNPQDLIQYIDKNKSQAKKLKPSKGQLKEYYLGGSVLGQKLTFFFPEVFVGQVLTVGLAVDCNYNLKQALDFKFKKRYRKNHIKFWEDCIKNLYQGQIPSEAQKALNCLAQ